MQIGYKNLNGLEATAGEIDSVASSALDVLENSDGFIYSESFIKECKKSSDYKKISNFSYSIINDFKPKGCDNLGSVYGSNLGGTVYRKTKDGLTYEDFEPSIGFTSIWFDSNNNKYATNGVNFYRAEANSWDFVLSFTLENANAVVANWGFTEDGQGNICVSSYGLNLASNTDIYISHNYGETFTRKNPFELGQKHYHVVKYHKYSGKLYLIVGEDGTWNGITVSSDKGESFTQLHEGYRPTSALEYGDYIIFGQDQSPTSFIYLNTTNDAIDEIVKTYSGIGTSPNTIGYIFSMVLDNDSKLIIAPTETESNTGGYSGILLLDLVTRETHLVEAYQFARARQNRWIFGTDSIGNSYLDLGNGDSLLIKKQKLDKLMPLKTYDTGDVLNIYSLTSNTTEYFGELPVYKLVNNTYGITILPQVAVSSGDIINICFIFKGGDGVAPTIRVQNFTDLTTNTSVYKSLAENTNFTDKARLVNMQYVVPAGISYIQMQLQQGSTGVGANYFGNKIVISKGNIGYSPLSFGRAFKKYYVEIDFAKGSFETTIINPTSTTYLAVNYDLSLLNISNISIGIRNDGESKIYVKQNGIDIGTVYGSQYGGSYNGSLAILSNAFREQKIIPCPIKIIALKDSIKIMNMETNQYETFNITPLPDVVRVEFTGNCYHFPNMN